MGQEFKNIASIINTPMEEFLGALEITKENLSTYLQKIESSLVIKEQITTLRSQIDNGTVSYNAETLREDIKAAVIINFQNRINTLDPTQLSFPGFIQIVSQIFEDYTILVKKFGKFDEIKILKNQVIEKSLEIIIIPLTNYYNDFATHNFLHLLKALDIIKSTDEQKELNKFFAEKKIEFQNGAQDFYSHSEGFQKSYDDYLEELFSLANIDSFQSRFEEKFQKKIEELFLNWERNEKNKFQRIKKRHSQKEPEKNTSIEEIKGFSPLNQINSILKKYQSKITLPEGFSGIIDDDTIQDKKLLKKVKRSILHVLHPDRTKNLQLNEEEIHLRTEYFKIINNAFETFEGKFKNHS
jgi:hypothetical protein